MQYINDILENMQDISKGVEKLRMLKNWTVLKELQNVIILINNFTKQRVIIIPPELCEK